MPERETIRRAQRDKAKGKSPGTQAGEFVREEMHHIREGKHGARSRKQAIAIGLSKARRAGVALPGQGKTSRNRKTGKKIHAYSVDRERSRGAKRALKRAGRPKLSGTRSARESARKAARTRARARKKK